MLHDSVQSASQPVFGPFAAPKSQASPSSTTPLPHPVAPHEPAMQIWPMPHALPSCAGSATGTHTLSLHVCIVHGGGAGQSVAGSMHAAVQSTHASGPASFTT